MRETTFLKQNEKKWEEYDRLLQDRKAKTSPDLLAELYIELTDDLAYAKTQFPGSKTTEYLNQLTAKVHLLIYKNKRDKAGSKLWTFWKVDLPLLFKDSHFKLLYAFVIFFIAAAVGWISTEYDENFLRLILGDDYVNSTRENILRGDPMAVYGKGGQVDTFTFIAFNNVRVMLMTFAAGILFSLGTGFLLAYNGIMLGAFHAYLNHYGHLQESLTTVYVHGALEIPAILLAGTAGFELGHSLLFPRSYTRLESLKRGALRGMKIAVGIIPIIIFAAFLEGFVTRLDMPVFVNLTIIFGSLAFIVYYFIIYPINLHNQIEIESG